MAKKPTGSTAGKTATSRSGSRSQAGKKPATIELAAEDVTPKAKPGPTSAKSEAASSASASKTAAKGGKGAPAADAKAPASKPAATAKPAAKPAGSGERDAKPAAGPPPSAEQGASPGDRAVTAIIAAVIAVIVVFLFNRAGFMSADTTEDLTQLRGNVTELSQRSAAIDERLGQGEQAISDLAGRIAADADTGEVMRQLQDRIAALESSGSEGAGGQALSDLAARITALESRPLPEGAGPGIDVAALEARLDALSKSVADLETALASRGANGVEEVRQGLSDLAAGLERLRTEVASQVEAIGRTVSEIDTRMDAIAAASAEVAARADRAETSAMGVAPAVVAISLADALESNQSFEAELAALQRVDPAMEIPESLASHAATGLPTAARLADDFDAMIPALLAGTGNEEELGTIDRLLKSAREIVDVRPAGPVEGDDPYAVISRMAAALADGNLGLALQERQTLPADFQEKSEDWAELTKARAEADQLAGELRKSAMTRLGSKS